MPAIANTFLTSAAKGNREELSDIIDRLTPEDTPVHSMASKKSAKSLSPEWETDTLRNAAANAKVEGDQFSYNAVAAMVRQKNWMQIMSDSWIISASQDAVDNAGKAEQQAEARIKAGLNLKRDAEFAFVSNTASVGAGTRALGGLPSWITTNVSRGAGGANGGYNAGTGLTVAETTGTQRAFSKAIMDSVLQQARMSGGKPKSLLVSPYVKSVFATFMSDANVVPLRMAVDKQGGTGILSDVEFYVGPHGKVVVMDSTVMGESADAARRAFFLDAEKLEICRLRAFSDADVVPNADAKAGVIIGELTLKVKNERGLGIAADLFGLTASS